VTSGHESRSRPRCASPAGGDLPGGGLDTRPTPSTTITRLDQTSISAAFHELGDLPLAIAQAAGFMAGTGTPAEEYLGLLWTRVRTSDYGAFCRDIAVLARDQGIRLREVLPTDESLESVFAYLVAKFVIATGLTMIFAAIPELIAALIAGGGVAPAPAGTAPVPVGPGFVGLVSISSGKLALGLFVGALACSVIYNAVFVMVSVATTRAIAVGLLYVLVWETLLSNFVSGSSCCR
jgi:hypothetical protein